jgi:PadR family transcriptional regulator, regulatory protein PadR
MHDRSTRPRGPTCSCTPSGRMLGFIQPWLLLLLSEAGAHGYDLLERLNENVDTRGVDPGFLYRTLRQFEEDGLVKSSWDVEGRGPARRVYEITPDGVEYLHAWADHIRSTRDRLGRLLEVYESRSKPQITKERR